MCIRDSLSFRLNRNKCIETNYTKFYDKVDSKFLHASEDYLKSNNIRIVPQAIARYGSFIDKNVVLMPSFVNIGAYVGEGTMVDTWATVGSCAQIGSNVHLSGGVGIGGVLEPLQASPTIIEDNCFIGARLTQTKNCLLYTSPSPRDVEESRMPSSA